LLTIIFLLIIASLISYTFIANKIKDEKSIYKHIKIIYNFEEKYKKF
jgi:hypothetical protein